MHLTLVAELKGHEDRVWQVCWDPTGTKLASSSGDKSVRVWQPLKHREFFTQPPTESHMAIDSDMRNLWECADNIDNAHKRTVRSVSFDPATGSQLASASFDGTTAIWAKDTDQSAYECIATLEGHENEAKCVAWSPSGQLIATCGRDKSVWIWEAAGEGDFDCISVLMEHTQDVKMVLWHPVEELLASFSYDDTVRIWKDDGDDWYSAAVLEGHTSTVWSGAFSPDGEYLASASDDRTVRVWAREQADKANSSGGFAYQPGRVSYRTVAAVPDTVHKRAIYSVAWGSPGPDSADGELGYVATGCGDNALRVFRASRRGDLAAKAALDLELVAQVVDAHGLNDINHVAWNPVYPLWLATAGDDNVVRIWYLGK